MLMHSKRMANVVSALTARTQFGHIVMRASQKNERFVVDRRGPPGLASNNSPVTRSST